MRKRFLTVAAATAMTMALATTAFADAPSDYTAYFQFEGNLNNEAEGSSPAELAGKLVTEEATMTDALYAEGVDGQAVSLDATYGLKLGKLVTSDEYTISMDIKLHDATFGTAGVFVESMNGKSSPEQWDSLMPCITAGTMNPRLWSNDNSGHRYTLEPQDESGNSFVSDQLELEKWVKLTVVKGKDYGTIYVNGEIVAKGWTEDSSEPIVSCTSSTVNDDTLVWLGINYWDTPLNADVDNLYVYDRALTDDEITAFLGEITDSRGELLATEFEAPALDNTNYAVKVETDTDESNDNMTVIICVVVAVVAVVLIAAVVVSSKKKKGNDLD